MVEYRKHFVARMEELATSLADWDFELNKIKIPETLPPGEKPKILITHDELTFNASDGIRSCWLLENPQILRPKARGKGNMASDCTTPWGRLRVPETISGEAMREARILDREPTELLEYGKDNWWDAEKMCNHILNKVLPMFELVYLGFQGVFLFDNATNHACFAEDALNAYKMGMTPGGEQPKMRDVFDYKAMMQQSMVDEKGVAKDLRRVLKERKLHRKSLKMTCSTNHCKPCQKIFNLWAANMKKHPATSCQGCQSLRLLTKKKTIRCPSCQKIFSFTPLPAKGYKECKVLKTCCDDPSIDGCCARRIMSLLQDFQAQKGKLQEEFESRGHLVLFYLKLHCELNWIEYYWGASKRYVHNNCDYTIEGLRENIPAAFNSVSPELINEFYKRTQRMLAAYKEGHRYGTKDVTQAYKSHRRVKYEEDDI